MTKNEAVLQNYLDLMDQQRESVYRDIKLLENEKIWERPKPNEWCIGEILDHTRAINSSVLPLLRVVWFFNRSLAQLKQDRPYAVEIDDVYHRPGFPMNLGWLWPPKHTPGKPAPMAVLMQSLRDVHQKYRDFYSGKKPDLLGNIHVYDPVVGKLNLILVLRVGLYHDRLHYQDVKQMAAEYRLNTTPVA